MPENKDKVIIHIDGGSRGNPGPAAAGFTISNSDGKMICAKGVFLGHNTNNFAEYSGMLYALKEAKSLGAKNVQVFSDSQLMVRQIHGIYKVKSDNIRDLYQRIMSMLAGFSSWDVQHVYREKNKHADKLVNMALDAGKDVEPLKKASPPAAKPVRLGVLISGGGTTLLNIQKLIEKGQLNVKVAVVISSLSKAAGVQRAKKAGLDVKVIRKKDYPDIDQFSKVLEDELTKADVDLVIQAGWLCLWKIPEKYNNKVMNIHPALLPSFGGKGMWGHHVHQAVLEAGCKVSGCTVHFCNNNYDSGPIIVQRCCEVQDTDNADTLAERVFQEECIAYPEAIRLFAEGKLAIKNGKVKLKQESS